MLLAPCRRFREVPGMSALSKRNCSSRFPERRQTFFAHPTTSAACLLEQRFSEFPSQAPHICSQLLRRVLIQQSFSSPPDLRVDRGSLAGRLEFDRETRAARQASESVP